MIDITKFNDTSDLVKKIIDSLKTKQSESSLTHFERDLMENIGRLQDGLMELNTEITEAKKACKNCKEKQDNDLALLHSLLESPEGINIFAVDHQYQYMAFTDTHKKIMKEFYGVDILIGSNFLEQISNSNESQRAKQNIDRVLRGESISLFREFSDDTIIRPIFEAFQSPVRDTKGNIIGVFVFVFDITERITAIQTALNSEEKLRESEKKYRLLAENSSDGIIHVGADKTINYVSPAYITQLGYSENHEVYQHIESLLKLVHPNERNALDERIEDAIRSKKEKLIFSYRIKRNEGDYIWREDSAHFQYDSNGNYGGFYAICRDITERKQIELKLQESLLNAEAGNRLKTTFIQNISHEVRTPLNGILGFSDLLADPNVSGMEKEHYNILLKKSSDRLISTITDYMDISMIESGNVELRIKTLNINNLINSVNLKYQEACEMKNISFNLHIPVDYENIKLTTDFELLTKCVYQLLDNAVKFTKYGSITFGYNLRSEFVEFFVRDTGIGIETEAQERIFEPFEQESQESTRGFEGNGLGLSITREFLKLLGGDIRVESEKGFGTTFYFTVPLKADNQNKPEPIISQVNRSEAVLPVILIAEDDLMSDIYLKNILRPYTSNIYKAANGKEAMVMCAKNPEISLVLMDLKMPVMDGFEATRQIRTFRKDLPIIAISAYALAKDKKEAYEAGVTDFLPKPVGKAELFEKLRKYGLQF
jgi:PAS domain S-box-containing protein